MSGARLAVSDEYLGIVPVGGTTSLVSFDHKLVNRCQLGVVEFAHLIGLDVWHVGGARVLEILESFRDEQTQHFQVCCLDGIKDLQALCSIILESA